MKRTDWMWRCANEICTQMLEEGAAHAVVAGSMRRGKEFPDEETFFRICGLPVPRPEERNAMWFSQMTASPSGSREMVGV